MTDAEKQMRELAQAATTGPWEVDGAICVMGDVTPETWETVCMTGDFMETDEGEKKTQNEANARYIAAANPAAVAALLARIEELEAAAVRASAELRHVLSYRKPDGCIDTNLVSRAVVLLEEATTPNRPKVKP